MLHVYRLGGDWHREGIDYTVKTINDDEKERYLKESWFLSFDELKTKAEADYNDRKKPGPEPSPEPSPEPGPEPSPESGPAKLTRTQLHELLVEHGIEHNFNSRISRDDVYQLCLEHGLIEEDQNGNLATNN